MNRIAQIKIGMLRWLFLSDTGVRAAARIVCVHRDTAMRERRRWIDDELQRAYDALWDGDCEGCDAIAARLPDMLVREMLDAWYDDWCNEGPKSRWH